jgi:hypothetical protein
MMRLAPYEYGPSTSRKLTTMNYNMNGYATNYSVLEYALMAVSLFETVRMR